MKIDIQTKYLISTNEMEDYITNQIESVLHGQYNQIQKVRLRLSAMRQANGGEFLTCWVMISLPQYRDIVVEYTATELYTSVDNAISTAARVLKRRLSRERYKKRKLFIPHTSQPAYVMSEANS